MMDEIPLSRRCAFCDYLLDCVQDNDFDGQPRPECGTGKQPPEEPKEEEPMEQKMEILII